MLGESWIWPIVKFPQNRIFWKHPRKKIFGLNFLGRLVFFNCKVSARLRKKSWITKLSLYKFSKSVLTFRLVETQVSFWASPLSPCWTCGTCSQAKNIKIILEGKATVTCHRHRITHKNLFQKIRPMTNSRLVTLYEDDMSPVLLSLS